MKILDMVVSAIEHYRQQGLTGPFTVVAHSGLAGQMAAERVEETCREMKLNAVFRFTMEYLAEGRVAIFTDSRYDDAVAETADYQRTQRRLAWREENACDVCGNWPDNEGVIDHGRGCYTQSSDGGGTSYVEPPDFSKLE